PSLSTSLSLSPSPSPPLSPSHPCPCPRPCPHPTSPLPRDSAGPPAPTWMSLLSSCLTRRFRDTATFSGKPPLRLSSGMRDVSRVSAGGWKYRSALKSLLMAWPTTTFPARILRICGGRGHRTGRRRAAAAEPPPAAAAAAARGPRGAARRPRPPRRQLLLPQDALGLQEAAPPHEAPVLPVAAAAAAAARGLRRLHAHVEDQLGHGGCRGGVSCPAPSPAPLPGPAAPTAAHAARAGSGSGRRGPSWDTQEGIEHAREPRAGRKRRSAPARGAAGPPPPRGGACAGSAARRRAGAVLRREP
uniref:Uncharacterized protein n=1 Tax=Nothoprocta perdicaria TaxID=30464 RepID=A0A8C6YQ60_NOTPE